MDTKSRTLTILDGEKNYKIRYNFSSILKSAMLYAAAHDSDFFKGMLNREYFDKALSLYGIPKGKPQKNELVFDFRGGPLIRMDSRTTPEKKYNFSIPFPVKGQNLLEVLDGYAHSCNCYKSKHSKKDVNVDMGCVHFNYNIIFSAEKLQNHNWGVGRRARRIIANVIRKIVKRYGRKMRGDEINNIFYEDTKRFNKILKEEILIDSRF